MQSILEHWKIAKEDRSAGYCASSCPSSRKSGGVSVLNFRFERIRIIEQDWIFGNVPLRPDTICITKMKNSQFTRSRWDNHSEHRKWLLEECEKLSSFFGKYTSSQTSSNFGEGMGINKCGKKCIGLLFSPIHPVACQLDSWKITINFKRANKMIQTIYWVHDRPRSNLDLTWKGITLVSWAPQNSSLRLPRAGFLKLLNVVYLFQKHCCL